MAGTGATADRGLKRYSVDLKHQLGEKRCDARALHCGVMQNLIQIVRETL